MLRHMVCAFALTTLGLTASAEPCVDGHRAIEHLAGVTCVVNEPQRIVTLHGSTLTIPVYELGAGDRLVGQYSYRGSKIGEHVDYHTSLEYRSGQFEPIGPNDFEKIASLHPDLIIGGNNQIDSFDQLLSIGPTVLFDWEKPVLEFVKDIANTINRDDAYARLHDTFIDRAKEIKDRLAGRPQIDVAFVTAGHFPELWVSRRHGAMSDAMDYVGIRTAPAVIEYHEEIFGRGTTKLRTALSTERIDIIDADLLLMPYWYFLVDPDADLETFDHQLGVEFVQDALEKQLPGYCSFLEACQAKQLIIFESTPHYTWSFSGLFSSLDFIEFTIVPLDILQIIDGHESQ